MRDDLTIIVIESVIFPNCMTPAAFYDKCRLPTANPTILGGSKSPTMHEIRIRKIDEFSIKRSSVQAFFEWVRLISTVFERFFCKHFITLRCRIEAFCFSDSNKKFCRCANCAKALSRNKQKALDAKYNILTSDHVPILLCWNLRLSQKRRYWKVRVA